MYRSVLIRGLLICSAGQGFVQTRLDNKKIE